MTNTNETATVTLESSSPYPHPRNTKTYRVDRGTWVYGRNSDGRGFDHPVTTPEARYRYFGLLKKAGYSEVYNSDFPSS